MPLDPTLAAGIVQAAGTVFGAVVGRVPFGSQTGEADPKAKRIASKVYDQLRVEITDNSFRVLMLMENGDNQSASQVAVRLYPDVRRPLGEFSRQFDDELAYRLRFLCLLGLLTTVSSEFAITKLGRAYLTEARERRDYGNLLRASSV
jgi:hypothetical protein